MTVWLLLSASDSCSRRMIQAVSFELISNGPIADQGNHVVQQKVAL